MKHSTGFVSHIGFKLAINTVWRIRYFAHTTILWQYLLSERHTIDYHHSRSAQAHRMWPLWCRQSTRPNGQVGPSQIFSEPFSDICTTPYPMYLIFGQVGPSQIFVPLRFQCSMTFIYIGRQISFTKAYIECVKQEWLDIIPIQYFTAPSCLSMWCERRRWRW